MKKKKLKKKINKTVTAYLKPLGIAKAKLKDEYSYYYDKDMVTFKIDKADEEYYADIWFRDFLADRFSFKIDTPILDFIMSLLHECGHAIANEEIEGAIYEFCQNEKLRISVETMVAIEADNLELGKQLEYQYFNLPDEIMATQWAVWYAENHTGQIEKMKKDFEPLFNKWRMLTE
jgi:hypothetical protein